MTRFLMWATRGMPAKAIDRDDEFYIERYRVFGIGRLEVLLHRYLDSYGDEEVHDHPHKRAVGIPLCGGYTEERVIGFCDHEGWISEFVNIRPWRWNWVSSTRFHRIASVKPGTWTLFIRWHRFKGWFFAKRRWSYSDPGKVEVVLTQPFEETNDDWYRLAPSGHEFRVSRGTN